LHSKSIPDGLSLGEVVQQRAAGSSFRARAWNPLASYLLLTAYCSLRPSCSSHLTRPSWRPNLRPSVLPSTNSTTLSSPPATLPNSLTWDARCTARPTVKSILLSSSFERGSYSSG